MTEAGTNGSGRRRRLRPLVAVLALYALVLQIVLGGAAEPPAAGPASVRCLPQADGFGSGPDHGSMPDGGPGHRHAGCCTAAPPELAALSASPDLWSFRSALRLAWTPRKIRDGRPSPGRAANARAPPVV